MIGVLHGAYYLPCILATPHCLALSYPSPYPHPRRTRPRNRQLCCSRRPALHSGPLCSPTTAKARGPERRRCVYPSTIAAMATTTTIATTKNATATTAKSTRSRQCYATRTPRRGSVCLLHRWVCRSSCIRCPSVFSSPLLYPFLYPSCNNRHSSSISLRWYLSVSMLNDI